jgi:hypothetical protein
LKQVSLFLKNIQVSSLDQSSQFHGGSLRYEKSTITVETQGGFWKFGGGVDDKVEK